MACVVPLKSIVSFFSIFCWHVWCFEVKFFSPQARPWFDCQNVDEPNHKDSSFWHGIWILWLSCGFRMESWIMWTRQSQTDFVVWIYHYVCGLYYYVWLWIIMSLQYFMHSITIWFRNINAISSWMHQITLAKCSTWRIATFSKLNWHFSCQKCGI